MTERDERPYYMQALANLARARGRRGLRLPGPLEPSRSMLALLDLLQQRGYDGLTVGEAARTTGVGQSTVSRVLARLAQMGVAVDDEWIAEDGRQRHGYWITDLGRRVAVEVLRHVKEEVTSNVARG